MLLSFIYVRRWRLSCIVAVYCKYSFTMGSPWPFLSRIRYPAVSSTRSYIVNLASPPIFIPHPNQHTNRISLSYTLAYAIYCGQMMHIWRLRFTLIWTIVRQSLCKKWTRLACGRGFAGFWFELGTDFYVGGLDVFWNRLMRMGYCRQNIGFDNRLPLHILDLMMWLVGVWKDLGWYYGVEEYY